MHTRASFSLAFDALLLIVVRRGCGDDREDNQNMQGFLSCNGRGVSIGHGEAMRIERAAMKEEKWMVNGSSCFAVEQSPM